MSKPTMGLRRAGIASVATGALALSGLALGAGAANADADFEFSRLAGDNRYETAGDVYDAFGESDSVILANGEQGHFPDALVANYLAGVEGSPILLTRSDKMPAATESRLDGGGKAITIVGGEAVVSAEQEAALVAEGHTVERLGGDNRYETAAAVINHVPDAASNTAIVTTGVDFPDALAAGPVSVHEGSPVGITRAADMNDAVKQALVDSGVDDFIVLGGPTIVSDAVVGELEAAGLDFRDRVFGADRAETSTELADYAIEHFGLTDDGVNVASGYIAGTGADALAGGPLTGQQTRPMLITKSNTNPGDAVLAWLEAHANTLTEGIIFGGLGAVDQASEDEMEAAARSVTSNETLTVSPSEAATLTRVPNPETPADTSDDRQYTVSGLDNTKTYTVALFSEDEVNEDANGVFTFDDTDSDEEADRAGVSTDITVVNGAPATNNQIVSVSPVNGSISFTIDGDDVNETVVPVVWLEDGNTGALDLVDATPNNDDPKQPAEAFGVGGATTYGPAEAEEGALATDEEITAVDKDAQTITTADAFYSYDENDTFYVITGGDGDEDSTHGPGDQVTFAEFEAELSAGDELDDETFYQTNEALSSQFVLEDREPTAPVITGATDQTEDSVTLTLTGVEDGDTVKVYGDEDETPGTEDSDNGTPLDTTDDTTDETVVTTADPVLAQSATDADADAANFQIVVSGLDAESFYDFAATVTRAGEESDLSNELENVETAAVGSTIAPELESADLVTDAVLEGAATVGDEWSAVFSENVNVVNADDAGTTEDDRSFFNLTDADGDTIRVVCATAPAANALTEATCTTGDSEATDTDGVTDDEITITLLEDGVDRNAGGEDDEIEYPLTVNSLGNVFDADTNEAVIADGADVVID